MTRDKKEVNPTEDPSVEPAEPKAERLPYKPPTLEPLGSVWESTAGVFGSAHQDSTFPAQFSG